jgi:hypothetical protein
MKSTYTETCPCGSRFALEMEGWGIRTFDFSEPLSEGRLLHRRHIEASHKETKTGPTKDQIDRLRRQFTHQQNQNHRSTDV